MVSSKQMKAILLPALLCLGLVGCMQGHEQVVVMAVGLETIDRTWVKQGQPQDFDPMAVVRSSVERYYRFTNDVKAAGTSYRCRFAGRSQLVLIPGAMGIH